MVLTHTTNHTYSHPFPTVTLAFFLRYFSPQLNPFSAHVLSTDTISSELDAQTGRLYTTRIHLKKSRMPGAVYKILPSSVTGGGGSDKSSYVLESSIVDIQEGWMKTESRNLNYTGVLSVIEQQHYSTTPPDQAAVVAPATSTTRPLSPNTYVSTTFKYQSNLGARKPAAKEQDDATKQGFGGWVRTLGASKIQRSIESIARHKTEDQMGKSREGMKAVLERLRNNSVVVVLRELRRQQGKTGLVEA